MVYHVVTFLFHDYDKLQVRSQAAKRIGVRKMINVFRVWTTVVELVMFAATVVVHCTLIKRRENFICSLVFFTAMHRMQTWSSDDSPSVCLSVCLSVRLSVKHVDCDKTEEKSVQMFIPNERSFSLVFWEVEWLVWPWGRPVLPEFWVNWLR